MLSGGFIESPSVLFNSIRSIFSENSQSGSVIFVESRSTLVIKTKLLVVDVTWTIPMERLEVPLDVKFAFLVNQMNALKASTEKLSLVSEQLTSRIVRLEGQLGFSHPTRVFAPVNDENFTLSMDRITLKKTHGGAKWQGFLSEHSLQTMFCRFTMSINTAARSHLIVGVAKHGTDPVGGFYSKAGSWMLYIHDGSTADVRYNGNQINTCVKVPVTNGSLISVRINPYKKRLKFLVNGATVHIVEISEPAANLFAAVDFSTDGQSVTFV